MPKRRLPKRKTRACRKIAPKIEPKKMSPRDEMAIKVLKSKKDESLQKQNKTTKLEDVNIIIEINPEDDTIVEYEDRKQNVLPSNNRPNARISLGETKYVFYNIGEDNFNVDDYAPDDEDEGLKLIIVDLED